MFQQLRLKMTLINAGVTMLLFVILISGAAFLLRYNAQQTSLFFFHKITEAVVDKGMTDFPPRHEEDKHNKKNHGKDAAAPEDDHPPGIFPMPRLNFFFVHVNDHGEITNKSSYVTVNDNTLQLLAAQIFQEKKYTGDIDFAENTFSYMQTPLKNGQTLIVLNDTAEETELFYNLLYNLSLVGIFCTLLSFFVSAYLAKHAIRPIQYATEQQKNFVSNASHELRTPITIIQANLDILNGSPPEDTLAANKKWLENIQDETTRMTELINALLFLARADAQQQLLEKEIFSLSATCKRSVASFELLALEKEISLSFTGEEGISLLGDPARILQLLTIFIDNALHHTSAGGQILVCCSKTQNKTLLSVQDSGDGIAEEEIHRIFDRFYQSDASRNRSGAGLGLSMAKWIASQHGGQIQVESARGKGSTFKVSFPLINEE